METYTGSPLVALLAEGVDRNKLTRPGAELERASPSSRRAWIEIFYVSNTRKRITVALLAEGVDRNNEAKENIYDGVCRPPRGGRG